MYPTTNIAPNPLDPSLTEGLTMVITDNLALFGHNLPLCIFSFVSSGVLFGMGCYSCWKQQQTNR